MRLAVGDLYGRWATGTGHSRQSAGRPAHPSTDHDSINIDNMTVNSREPYAACIAQPQRHPKVVGSRSIHLTGLAAASVEWTVSAVASIFFLPRRRKLRPKGPKAGCGSWGRGSHPLLTSYLGSVGNSPERQTIFTRFKCSEWPLQAVWCCFCPLFHSGNFCQGKSYEKQPRRLPRLPQWTLRHSEWIN